MKPGYWKLFVAVLLGIGVIGQFQAGRLGMMLLQLLLCFGFIAWFCYSRYKIKEAKEAEDAEQQRLREEADRSREQLQRIRDLDEKTAAIRLQLETETLERFRNDAAAGKAPKLMYIKVVGVTFANEDGTERQEILEELDDVPGYMIEVELDPYTYHGEPAVRVFADGQQIGNIDKDLAPYITENFQKIEQISDFEIVGGDGLNYGARFTIQFKE